MFFVNEPLLELFRAHGLEAALLDDWIIFPDSSVRAAAAVVQEIPQTSGVLFQLSVQMEVAPGTVIDESFAGLGDTRDAAIADGYQNFAANSFHVLLKAFLQPNDTQVEEDTWTVGEATRRVILGNAGFRGAHSAITDVPLDWFAAFQARLAQEHLGPEVHWVRLYYAQAQNKTSACEVLLDNEQWPELQAAIGAFAWPKSQSFYSARVFLVVLPTAPDPQTPEGAVSILAQAAARPANENAPDEELYQAMENAHIPERLANRVFNFTQIAWGRILLDGMGIVFSPEYIFFDANGTVIEKGLLSGDRSFVAATRLCPRYRGTPAFKRISVASADVNAVNQVMQQGIEPAGLKGSPAFLFAEAPTEAGWGRARKTIDSQTGKGKENAAVHEAAPPEKSRKSRWKFWER